MKNFNIFKLKNGMEVILIPRKESPATTVMVTVMVGSKYETKDISGLSHFLEHMAFKGTKKRPRPIDISSELDSLGANYNAFTSQEQTLYYAKIRNERFDKALDIVSDLYLNPTVLEEELEKEKGVIIEEINMYEDMPMRKIGYNFLKVLYGDQPAGWHILGRKEVIQKLKREDFINYREKHYKSENTILTIAGGYSEKGIKNKIENTFSSLERQPETKMPEVKEKQSKPNELIEFKKSDQTHLVLGFRAFDVHDERQYALEALADILGGGASSRLFQKIREDLGLAYYVGASANLSTNNGRIKASAGVNKNKTEEVIKIILEEFQKMKEEPVTKKELTRVKESFAGSLLLSLETSSSQAMFYTYQRVMKLEPLTPEQIIEKTNAVTAEDIQAVANDLFKNEGLNLALIGPFKNKSFGDILKI